MNKWLAAFLLITLPLRAAEFDTLLYEATRYANTPEKREAKVAARASLKEQMPDAFRAAMDHVHGDNVGLQVMLMEWVYELPSETVVPVLAEYIDHSRVETRRIAIYFLGFHQAPELAERVTKHLDDDKARGAAMRTLSKWKIVSARPAIEQTLANGTERQRVVAANALRDIGDPGAIPALINALDDPVFTVRNTAARALVSFGDAARSRLSDQGACTSDRANRIRERCLAEMNGTEAAVLDQTTIAIDGSFFTWFAP